MLTIASYISLSRILLTPVIMLLLVQHQWFFALMLFGCAAMTDLLDGFVARRLGQESKVGELIDPIADKCLLMGVLYTLLFLISVDFWQQAMVWFLIFKDIFLLAGAAWLKLRHDFFIKPSFLSRVASMAEFIVIFVALTSMVLFGHVSTVILPTVLTLSTALSLVLLVRYAGIVAKIIR